MNQVFSPCCVTSSISFSISHIMCTMQWFSQRWAEMCLNFLTHILDSGFDMRTMIQTTLNIELTCTSKVLLHMKDTLTSSSSVPTILCSLSVIAPQTCELSHLLFWWFQFCHLVRSSGVSCMFPRMQIFTCRCLRQDCFQPFWLFWVLSCSDIPVLCFPSVSIVSSSTVGCNLSPTF